MVSTLHFPQSLHEPRLKPYSLKMVQQLHLPNGRIVEYVIDGAPDGFPLVWCHGTPGACLPPPSLVTSCKAKGIKIISLSRAGYGGTTRKLGRRIVDSVADIRALNEHLGIERCVAAGWSGGGASRSICVPENTD